MKVEELDNNKLIEAYCLSCVECDRTQDQDENSPGVYDRNMKLQKELERRLSLFALLQADFNTRCRELAEMKAQQQTDALDGQAELDMTNNLILDLQKENGTLRSELARVYDNICVSQLS